MKEFYVENTENIMESLRQITALQEEEKVLIHIRAGRYFLTDTIELTGVKNLEIRGEGQVIFDGGIIIPEEEVKDYDEKIRHVDLKPYGICLGEYGCRGMARDYTNAPNELFINGDAYEVARYPKKDTIPFLEGDVLDGGSVPRHGDFGMRCARIRCRDERIKKWAAAKDAYLGGLPIHSWADDTIKIAQIDVENQTITTAQPHLYGFKESGRSSWYIVNLFEELTQVGEYFIDREAEILYFIPKTDLQGATIQLSVLDKVMIACEDSQNVVFDGITFENSRNSGIYIEGGENVQIRNCTFRNLGILAVQVGQGAEPEQHGKVTRHGSERAEGVPVPKPISREMGSWYSYLYEFPAWDNNAGKNHVIENCCIHHTGAGGIMLSGGNRKHLIPGNNKVHNCEFFQVNRLDRAYKAAVNIMGVGNVISHCEMYDMPGMAIYLHGNDHIIEYNKIHEVVKEVSDAGAIYMGRDMSEVGNVFRNNYIYDISNPIEDGLGVCAIYFDDFSIFNAVYDNFFYNIHGGGFCVIHHTCGGLLSFHNNIVIDCVPGVHPDFKSNSYIRMHTHPLSGMRVHTIDENDMHGVDITSKVYREKYPYLYETYKNDARYDWMYYNNKILNNRYKIFVDGKHGDFTLNESFVKSFRSHYDLLRRTDVVMGYENDLVMPHNIDFKSIGLVQNDKNN